MADIRHDPITDRWIIIAEDRANRPDEFADVETARAAGQCPFCPGSENDTPHEVLTRYWPAAALQPNRPSRDQAWRIRVFANRYPAVGYANATKSDAPAGASHIPRAASDDASLFRRDTALGVHEVVVDTSRHERSVTSLAAEHAVELFDVYAERLRQLKGGARLQSGLVFKNVGPRAGASIEHAHSQIVATEQIPSGLLAELTGARQWWQSQGECVYCKMIAAECHSGERIVAESRLGVAFCPFAARFPYETWVVPRSHESHFEEARTETVAQIAMLVQQVVRQMETVLDRPAYNYLIHSAPFSMAAAAEFHWHVELFPRITTLAGWELGTGAFINPVSPERAAVEMRSTS